MANFRDENGISVRLLPDRSICWHFFSISKNGLYRRSSLINLPCFLFLFDNWSTSRQFLFSRSSQDSKEISILERWYHFFNLQEKTTIFSNLALFSLIFYETRIEKVRVRAAVRNLQQNNLRSNIRFRNFLSLLNCSFFLIFLLFEKSAQRNY